MVSVVRFKPGKHYERDTTLYVASEMFPRSIWAALNAQVADYPRAQVSDSDMQLELTGIHDSVGDQLFVL